MFSQGLSAQRGDNYPSHLFLIMSGSVMGLLIPSSRIVRVDKTSTALVQIESINHLYLNSSEVFRICQLGNPEVMFIQTFLFTFLSFRMLRYTRTHSSIERQSIGDSDRLTASVAPWCTQHLYMEISLQQWKISELAEECFPLLSASLAFCCKMEFLKRKCHLQYFQKLHSHNTFLSDSVCFNPLKDM